MSDWSTRLTDLRALMAEKLGAGGSDLGQQIRRAGRRLPRGIRREAEFLARADEMARHPRFARLLDLQELARAEARVARHLRGIDPALLRRNRRKNMAAALAFYVLVALALTVTLLRWRGYV